MRGNRKRERTMAWVANSTAMSGGRSGRIQRFFAVIDARGEAEIALCLRRRPAQPIGAWS